MRAYVSTFRVPKRGCTTAENEDAAWVGPDGTRDGGLVLKRLHIAVADGATESLLAGRWAARLTRAFGRPRRGLIFAQPALAEGFNTLTHAFGCPRRGFYAAYEDAAREWNDIVARYCADREARGKPIQWYEEPGLQKGAHATLLATQFRDGGRRVWQAVAVGDSCVFQVRRERLLASFPATASADFSYSPDLLPSRIADRKTILRHLLRHTGEWQPADSFYVMTDALAAWFLKQLEAGGRPWEALRDLGLDREPGRFEEWVRARRDAGELRDDDTTLVSLDIL